MKKIITVAIILGAVCALSTNSVLAQIQLQASIPVPGLNVTQLSFSGYIPNTQAAPIITMGSTTALESSTQISWKTDKLSKSKVFYDVKPIQVQEALGPQYEPTVMNGSLLDIPTMATSTLVEIHHLLPRTTYYYFVQSTDKLGNITVTSQRTFTTK
jgi:hypothetical protein